MKNYYNSITASIDFIKLPQQVKTGELLTDHAGTVFIAPKSCAFKKKAQLFVKNEYVNITCKIGKLEEILQLSFKLKTLILS